jgi:hypothetical protein
VWFDMSERAGMRNGNGIGNLSIDLYLRWPSARGSSDARCLKLVGLVRTKLPQICAVGFRPSDPVLARQPCVSLLAFKHVAAGSFEYRQHRLNSIVQKIEGNT